MAEVLHVQWTLTPVTAPRPWLPCSGCAAVRGFESTGKFRINANGRKLDAWLIYRCAACGGRWNRPVIERRSRRDIDPALLQRLLGNDPQLADAIAFDGCGLRHAAARVEDCAAVQVAKVAAAPADGCTALHISIALAMPVAHRTDRLLAQELGLSRSRVQRLHDCGRLRFEPDGHSLRKPARDGLEIVLALDDMAHAVVRAATGAA